MYIYPENLKAKAKLWLWELKDVGIIGGALLLSVFALARMGIFMSLLCTAVFAFLTIRMDGTSVLDFLCYIEVTLCGHIHGEFFGHRQAGLTKRYSTRRGQERRSSMLCAMFRKSFRPRFLSNNCKVLADNIS